MSTVPKTSFLPTLSSTSSIVIECVSLAQMVIFNVKCNVPVLHSHPSVTLDGRGQTSLKGQNDIPSQYLSTRIFTKKN